MREDPYCNDYFQAKLVKQETIIYMDIRKAIQDKNAKRTRVHVEINLIPGGVEVVYNSDIVRFTSLEEETLFRREINAFFIRRGFFLNCVYFSINVYSCGTKEDSDNVEIIFKQDENILSDEDVKILNSIIAKIFVAKET